MKPRINLTQIGLAALVCLGIARAAEPEPSSTNLLRWPDHTLGGEQLWADEFIHGSWRIQRNVLTGHYRLLDPQDRRREFGDYGDCLTTFESCQRTETIPPMKSEIVIAIHGLLRSRDCMESLGKYLEKNGNYEVLNFGYPSSRGSISDHAAVFQRMFAQLPSDARIHIVGHSLGNIVVRCWLQEQLQQHDRIDPRLGRFVMLGPPNQGAQLAERFEGQSLFRLVWGKSGRQLGAQWHELDFRSGAPPCEFGILAGNSGLNPLIVGENDLCVSVEETKLPGASDFRVLPLNHTTLRTDSAAHKLVLQFLEQGYFDSESNRQPLSRNE